MEYQHLSRDNRITIAEENRRGASVAAIAGMVGCHPTTISREIKRNSIPDKHYEGDYAHRRADRRRTKASALPRKLKGKLLRRVLAKMKIGWSPDVIAGRMGEVSARAIYDYLHRQQRMASHHRPHRYLVRKLSGEPPYCYLPRGLGRYRKRGKAAPPLAMADALPISTRPMAANGRAHLGHYEIDTAMVKDGLILFAVCRSSRFVLARKLREKSADEVLRASKNMLAGYAVNTITSDRGSEFARYKHAENHFNADWYVCAPRCPHQRGSVEGVIGQMRRWFPKNMPASDVSGAKLSAVVRRLNNTPRKSLGYKSPAETKTEMTITPIPI
ncbi:MAG: IS30 family transposase [Gammaproteobacteria bacterium]